MGLSFSHILILAVVFILLFGRGKISEFMGDVAKGLRSFKNNLRDDEAEPAATKPALELEATRHQPVREPAEDRKFG
jgi:sec-independent protein translocase protein TatA